MKRPCIGITAHHPIKQKRYQLPEAYIDAIFKAGGCPLLIPHTPLFPEEMITPFDGIIFTGGGDIDPQFYGGDQHEALYNVNTERDRFEIALAKYCIQSKIRVLGVCRGAQILNVAAGGTLYEHLPDVVGEQILHRAPPRAPIKHDITVNKDSKLAAITQAHHFTCSSWHHQGIKELAPIFTPSAYAQDGIIEAFEHPSHPWLIGVQWHPEHAAATDPIQQRIFHQFIHQH